MRKRKSIRETKNMVQTALWLPRDVHERLKKTGGERGLGEEIRRRLQTSFKVEAARRDPITRELLDEIQEIAAVLADDEQWYANRFAFDVFGAAINELLLSYRPNSAAPGTMARYRADEKPETIGRILAHVFTSRRKQEVEPTAMDWGVDEQPDKEP
jgi:hypothetical protein